MDRNIMTGRIASAGDEAAGDRRRGPYGCEKDTTLAQAKEIHQMTASIGRK